ncbi:copper transport protein ATOX1-like [Dysidea avara]|uniref:copper transport protein ATOX1-like n=1 Tax=Dysidea avara TaxID=196820 RepID=UPI003325567D
MSKVHEYNVAMSCSGCSGAVQRVLGRLPEVEQVEIDMEKQKVYVTSSLSGDDLLTTIKKTGRECSYVGVKQ